MAGLLHDLGKIPLDTCLPEEYAQALELAGGGMPLDQAEREVMGLDHTQVGRMIGEKWQLNPGLIKLLANHHLPDHYDDNEETGEPLAASIALADAFVNLRRLGSAGNLYPDRQLTRQLARQWGLGKQEMASLLPEVEKEIERAKVFLAVARET
ncbi:MAG: HDOD domain-containing protein [Desulfurivibrio sp.]|nr:HDOD domain-containing protein [Desulfurivibrio sp.]